MAALESSAAPMSGGAFVRFARRLRWWRACVPGACVQRRAARRRFLFTREVCLVPEWKVVSTVSGRWGSDFCGPMVIVLRPDYIDGLTCSCYCRSCCT